MKFLDANVFLRFLIEPQTEADRQKYAACRRLFEDAQAGQFGITTSESVVHEVLYVLCSPRQYGLTHADAVARLRPIMSLRSLHLPVKRRYGEALALFASHRFLDFADAMAIAHVRAEHHELISYDTDYDRVPGVNRSQP